MIKLCLWLFSGIISQFVYGSPFGAFDPVDEHWRCHSYEELDVLNISVMKESPRGEMWFAHDSGVAVFNGEELHNYKINEELLEKVKKGANTKPTILLSFNVNSEPLLFYNDKILILKQNKWRLIECDHELAELTRQVLRSRKGSNLILKDDKLLEVIDDFRSPSTKLQITGGVTLLNFCEDEHGDVWLISKDQETQYLIKLSRNLIDPHSYHVLDKYELTDQEVTNQVAIMIDSEGVIWLSDQSLKFGLKSFDTKNLSWNEEIDTKMFRHNSMSINSRDSVWIGSRGSVYVKNRLNETKLFEPKKLSGKIIQHIHEDSQRRLWIITRLKRVFYIDLNESRYKTFDHLHYGCDDLEGGQWFIHKLGHVYYNRGEVWEKYTRQDGVLTNTVKIITTEEGLVIAFGSEHKQAAYAIFRDGKWEKFLIPQFSISLSSKSVFQVKDGSIYVGAAKLNDDSDDRGGILKYRVDSSLELKLEEHYEVDLNSRYEIMQSEEGEMWIGSMGLYLMNLNSESDLIKIGEIPSRGISSMTSSATGDLWVSVVGHGVFQFIGGKWINHSMEQGLISNNINDLFVLKDSSILALSEEGVSRFDGVSWMKSVFNNQLDLRLKDTIHEDLDGSIWINMIKRSRLRDEYQYYTVRVKTKIAAPETKFEFSPKSISEGEQVYLSWFGEQHSQDIENLSYQYSWRLNDGSWSAFNEQKNQALTDLKAGAYFMEVKARNADFVVDPTPARIEFEVVGPAWKQAWFVSLVLSMFLIIVWLIWNNIKRRERYLLEQQQERERHWTELNEFKDSFFSNITHELRTPLTVVLGRLNSMFENETNDKKKLSLKSMVLNANRVSSLITQLLDLRKLEDHKLYLNLVEGDISDYIREIVERHEPYAKEKKIEITFEGQVYGVFDPDKLDKIVSNLISNSIKYSDDNGSIKVSCGLTDCGGEKIIEIHVEDSGQGIPIELQESIFDRFYRVPSSQQVKGTGLGLNITKELIDLWGGIIKVKSPVYSDVNQPGTRMSVELPYLDGDEETKEIRQKHLDGALDVDNTLDEIYRVLVVEDDVQIRDFVIEEIRDRYQVKVAKNGAEGLEKAKSWMPDLIISDVMMPKMNGMDLCDKLKNQIETSHIPIIMLTAKSSLDSKLEGLGHGADAYITKPFHARHLKVTMINLLSNRKKLREKFSRLLSVSDQKIPENNLDQEFLEKLNVILEREVKDIKFDVDQLAKRMHMSTSTLRRKTKAITDKTPSNMIFDMRLKLAADLLLKSDLSIKQIALEVGFLEANHFARLFKKTYKVTATQYRESNYSV